MRLADPTTTVPPSAIECALRAGSEPNQNTYLRLKLSLSLSLRRQVFLAVCDNLTLRHHLSSQLAAELAYSAHGGLDAAQLLGQRSTLHAGEQRWQANRLGSGQVSQLELPFLVSLTLNLHHPNPTTQVAQWLTQNHLSGALQDLHRPSFQILGVEQLTRQPGSVQRQFLSYLQQIGQSFNSLDYTLLIWLTRPWFHSIQQSAPAFWNCHTGLFEFEGDPTPTSALAIALPAPGKPAVASTELQERAVPETVKLALQEKVVEPDEPLQQEPAYEAVAAQEKLPLRVEEASLVTAAELELHSSNPDMLTQNQQIWDMLNDDLARLSEEEPSLPVDTIVVDEPKLKDVQPEPDANLVETIEATVAPIVADEPQQGRSLPALLTEIRPELEFDQLVQAVLAPANAPAPHQSVEILQTLHQIEQLHQQDAPAVALATAYQILGNLFRDRVEQGDDSEEILLIAIYVYEQTLAWLEPDSLLWADLLNDIGNLYWMLARQALGSNFTHSYLEQSIAIYHLALSKTDPETRSQTHAMIQNNLGSVYGDLARYREPAKTLQYSIQAYEGALRYRTLEDDPARYAATQNNLGTAYWNLAQHQQPVLNLQSAIAAYTEALRYYSQSCEPLHYAMIQNNLGTAYWNLAQYESTNSRNGSGMGRQQALLTQAIAAYGAALLYRTLEVVPAAHAATQNNMGTAYWNLAMLSGIDLDDRRNYLQQAIVAYQSALTAVQYLATANPAHVPALTFDHFATHNNLGLSYYHLATDNKAVYTEAQRSGYLEAALQHHIQAMQGWSQQPDYYQTALSYIIQTVRAFYNYCGMTGQSLALSKVPANLLPELMRRL